MKNILFVFCCSLLCCSMSGQVMDRDKATVHFEIVNTHNEQPMPAKVVIYRDEKPYTEGWVEDENLVQSFHTIYTTTGKGSFKVPPGNYEFWFSKGMEYTAEERFIRAKKRGDYHIKIELTRALQTPNLIGGDMHLHTLTYSGHGDANPSERVISCIAEGLEWAVATDHNKVIDYAPVLDSLGLTGYISTTVGNEVSTKFGHFNTYPLPEGTQPVDVTTMDGKELFRTVRQEASDSTVIQVNHPRWILSDYFNSKGLDIYFGTVEHPEWSWDFDAIEVLNENGLLGWRKAHNNKSSVKKDWFNLLNHGHKICGVGNSDSHTVSKIIAGIPRNYIQSSTDNIRQIDEQELAANIKAQKVIVAQGILPQMTINDEYGVGETLSVGQDSILNLKLQVQAVHWVDCTKAELIENGQVIQTVDLKPSDKVLRLDTTVQVVPDKDSWYILVASGEKSMSPVAHIAQEPIYPLGFTNPIWVDANNDGIIMSIFEYSQQQLNRLSNDPKALLTALEAHPETIPYTVYFLFKNQHPQLFNITKKLLRTDQIDRRLMLFRELAKMKNEAATNLLTAQRKNYLRPLEEVVLDWYIQFPLHESRVDNFKAKEKGQLDEQLSYLETQFAYLYEQSREKTFQIASTHQAARNIADRDWQTARLNAMGLLDIAALPTDLQQEEVYIKQTFTMERDTVMQAYIRTNRIGEIYLNGENLGYLKSNLKAPVKEKLFPIPMQAGENELLIQLQLGEKVDFSFLEILPEF